MQRTLIIACGALAHELVAVQKANDWQHLEIQCLPAHWHNTPDKITPGVAQKIAANRDAFDRIVVAYGDCGTGGHLDELLRRENIERLPGAHCYSFFAGEDIFTDLADENLGTFYLTDYLAAHFDRLIIDELGIREHPELLSMYFGNYTHVLYLTQQDDPVLLAKAQAAATTLGLAFKLHRTGLAPFTQSLKDIKVVVHAKTD